MSGPPRGAAAECTGSLRARDILCAPNQANRRRPTRMAAPRKFNMKVASKQFGAFQARLVAVGATTAKWIRNDGYEDKGDASPGDVYATLVEIQKLKKCA